MENKRNRGYYRYQRHAHISKKLAVLRNKAGCTGASVMLLENGKAEYGRLSKNKIHCSCEHCRVHTGRCDWHDMKSRVHMKADMAEYI